MALIISGARFQNVDLWFSRGGGQLTPLTPPGYGPGLGILQIAIETGRYRSIPVEQRFCILCNANKIEDEIHILFECPKYDKIRFIWLHKLEISNFNLLNSKYDQLNIVFQFPRITPKYVVDIMKIRKSLL